MRWQNKTYAQWIRTIAENLSDFSGEHQIDLELISFEKGQAKVKLHEGEYEESLHIKLQELMDQKCTGIAIIFDF